MKKCEKFRVPFEGTNRVDSAVFNENVVVISVFGKSSYLASSCKVNFVDKLLGYNVFRQFLLDDIAVKPDVLCDIEGYFDKRERIIYLHLKGSYDANILVKILDEYCVQIEEKGYLSIWTDLKYKYARAVLFLFYVSHILIITHPTHVFDLSYIKLFRALDTVRSKLQNRIIDILKVIPDIPKSWKHNGRLCSPRLLFYFEKCPPEFKKQSSNGDSNIKLLEHAIEDQIYRILKKSKIVSNASYNALFAIPANQEFVFVETNEDVMQDWKNFCVNSLINSCFDPNLISNTDHCSFGYESLSDADLEMRTDNHSVKSFLKVHIDTAFAKGFDDNLSRHATSNNFFELCKARIWFEVAQKLYDYLVRQEKTDNEDDYFNMLHTILDTDQRFSEARCKKVFPMAIKTYRENSPSHYSKAYHESKAEQALSIFLMHARGSCVNSYIPELQKEFETYWKIGRQMCEVPSLTGHPCNLPLHKGGTGDFSSNVPDESINIDDLPVMEHNSGVRYVNTCNCGRRQTGREDPFSIRSANYDFYEKLGEECGCSMFQNLEFPVFTPSTTDYKAAKLLSVVKEPVVDSPKKDSSPTAVGLDVTGTDNMIHELTLAVYPSCNSMEPGASDMLLRDDRRDLHLLNDVMSHQLLNKPSPTTSLTPSMQNIVIQVTDTDSDVEKSDKNLIRQPSTTEYLPGMLHSESPVGLLPQFPSWSLICIGSSSLYSHNIGLQEHYCTGYIAGSSYLLPWDVTVRLTHHTKERFWNDRNKTPLRNNRRKGTKEFNVKIFVGNEYECPRGHRFTCCSPDKILKATGTGIVRDSGSKVANCDMPLYFPCPCRSSKPLTAQLIRIHIVTPKAPVHVTLNPRVQPAPNPCPVFITGAAEPFRLSQSAYWILRLPYVYYGDRGPYIPPKDSLPSMYGKLLAGMYGVVEMSPDS